MSCACHLPEVVRKHSGKQYSLAMPLVIEISVNGVFKFKEDIASAPAIWGAECAFSEGRRHRFFNRSKQWIEILKGANLESYSTGPRLF
jgi:hypothetical protein